MGIESNSGVKETKEQSPILKAKTTIEKRLVSMEETLGIFALQASLAGNNNGGITNAEIKQTDDFNKEKKNDIQRYYNINGYQVEGMRSFSFEALGITTPIEYKFTQKIDNNGNIIPVYERFSERYTVKLGNQEFTFENPESCMNFLFHFHRALDYKKKNNPVVFKLLSGGKIQIQSTIKDNKGDLIVKKNNYYRTLPNSTKFGVSNNNKVTYRNTEKKTTTDLVPVVDSDGNISLKVETDIVNYNQGYQNNYSQLTTTKVNTSDENIYTGIVGLLNSL